MKTQFEAKKVGVSNAEAVYNPQTISMPELKGEDKAILERFTKDSETIAKQKIAKYIGVKKACEECNITNPALIGIIFNAVDKEEL